MTVSLVLLPGLDGTGELFGPLLQELPEAIEPRVIRYPTHEPLDYPALSSLVVEQLPAASPFVLLGESFSGPVAVLVASRRPQGLLGVILCASFVSAPRRLPPWLFRLVPLRFAIRALGPWAILGRFRTPDRVRRIRDVLAPVPEHVLRARFEATARVDVTAELAALEVPTLYLRASEDAVVPGSAADRYARAAGGGTVEVIAGPHFLLQCAAPEAARSIGAFVRASSGEAGPEHR